MAANFSASHDSAICLIPPEDLWSPINSIRRLYDKAHENWPPHINLVYPFVRPDLIPEVVDILRQLDLTSLAPTTISLREADTFNHKNHNTIILRPRGRGPGLASELVNAIREAIGWPAQDDYNAHMTVGQTEDAESDSHNFLMNKARLLTPVTWDIGQLAILVRDSPGDPVSGRPMQLWGYIDIHNGQLHQSLPLRKFHTDASKQGAHVQETFQFSPSSLSWHTMADIPPHHPSSQIPDPTRRLVVASYNVLAEFQWPPNASRYPSLISNILSERAAADVLVLQEVTDHFLPFLLQDRDVRTQYQFSTHGPPGHPGHRPLPSLLNIVVLSKLPFSWEYLPFARKHKGAAVLKLAISNETSSTNPDGHPIILAACHLSQGLTDGAVVAKKNELHKLMTYLSTEFSRHPWIIAGDFNLATSAFSIDQARQKGQLSSSGYQYLCEIDQMFTDYRLQDAWLLTRLRSGVSQDACSHSQSAGDLFEGEQGATFDPLNNNLAEMAVGSGLNYRPQRYDRILFNNTFSLSACGFNTFGRPIADTSTGNSAASDHWGIRCLFKNLESDENITISGSGHTVATNFRKAPSSLGNLEDLKNSLVTLGCLPNSREEELRRNAFDTLRDVLCESDKEHIGQRQRAGLDVTFIPVGSYGLGVWTPDSDVDCLCVGNISSKTFFALAVSKLKRARNRDVNIIRIVRAKTGTMLELIVLGIKFDLQYCAAAQIAKHYPDIMNHPASDPAFNLPVQTLSKLKPARDLAYLRRSIPDLAKYRLAHLLVKAWAKSRGLYSARFGLLGGINVSAMLVPICKILAYEGRNATTADILTTFFHHYAGFDWRSDMVFDPLFHNNIKYHRTQRECMCLLGWHAPSLNTALNASVATVGTLSSELVRARNLLLQEGVDWNMFLCGTKPLPALPELTAGNASGFLTSYKSYIKIDARYWGSSPSKGRRFVGWLESRCVMILVDVNRKAPALATRIWPARFVSQGDGAESQEFHYSYLVGLAWQDVQGSNKPKEEAKNVEQSLLSILKDFENRIQTDQKYFDSGSCWAMTSLVSSNDVQQLQLDQQSWRDGNAGDTDSEGCLDLEGEEEEEDDSPQGLPTSTLVTLEKRSKGSKSSIEVFGSGKLRTATDVMNRLRWDSAMDSSNYLVGYEDRFTGAKEKDLGQWKTEQTDEEFIPQHRILYFKRKSDSFIVWERRTRTDNIFGSGVG